MVAMSHPTRAAHVAAVLLCLIPLVACGGRSVSRNSARDLIVNSPVSTFDKNEITVRSVSLTGQKEALVEASLHAAFRFEKVDGKWVIREVRLGKRPWENLDEIAHALELVKTEDTRKMLGQVASALERYRSNNGALPGFKDFVTLSDALFPTYMTPLIRLDAWQNPLAAFKTGSDTVRLLSAGPDGKFGTGDDIELSRSFGP